MLKKNSIIYFLAIGCILYSCSNGGNSRAYQSPNETGVPDSSLQINGDYIGMSRNLESSIASSEDLCKRLDAILTNLNPSRNDSFKIWKYQMDSFQIEANGLIEIVKGLRNGLISASEGVTTAEADTFYVGHLKHPSDVYVPTLFMLGEHPRHVSGSKSFELKKRIMILKNRAAQLSNLPHLSTQCYTGESWDEKRGANISWEWYHFYHRNVGTVLNFFLSMDLQIKQMEAIVLADMIAKAERVIKK